MIRSVYQWALIFSMLTIVFIPFSYHLIPWHDELINHLLLYGLKNVAFVVFPDRSFHAGISSDSFLLYVLIGLLFIVSVIIYLFSNKILKPGFYRFCRQSISIFLSLHLLKYGFDKIFKSQFYLPEPNILYTEIGMLDKDILFWSTMGTSYGYNVFMGMAEILPAILILFKRTRTIGLLIATAVMLHVVAINFSFDISVKLFSCLLLSYCLFLLVPHAKTLWMFFIQGHLNSPKACFPKTTSRQRLISLLVPVVLFTEALFPILRSGEWNDDDAVRPYLHGAYEVINNENSIKNPGIKRFFIHRDGYFIFSDSLGSMLDYKLEMNGSQFILTDYNLKSKAINYSFDGEKKILLLVNNEVNGLDTLTGRALNWKALPLMDDEFHWTVD